jgi:hypothetical protein
MSENFFVYLEHLELLAFFSGYPLVYAGVHFVAGLNRKTHIQFSSRMQRCLPFAYALMGSIFFLLWIRELIIQSGIKNLAPGFNLSFLKVWALGSSFFWIPALAKKPVYSLLHSLVFFSLLIKDIIASLGSDRANNNMSNDMKVYTISLVLNVLCLVLIIIAARVLTYCFPPRQS